MMPDKFTLQILKSKERGEKGGGGGGGANHAMNALDALGMGLVGVGIKGLS